MRDILVTYTGPDNILRIGFNGTTSKVAGKEWLVQKIVKAILTIAGSSAYDPNFGTAFAAIIGRSINKNNPDALKLEIFQAVAKVSSSIRKEQSTILSLLSNEKLKSLEIAGIVYDSIQNAYEVELTVIMEDNSTQSIKV